MKIRVFDKFDMNETVVIYDNVKYAVGNDIFFTDGDIETITDDEDWEEVGE